MAETTFGFSSGKQRLEVLRKVNMTSSVLDRFEAMLLEHAPTLLATLLPPATEAQIALAELNLGVQFPEEIRRVYLRQDGSNHCDCTQDGWLFVPFNWWASEDEVLSNWHMNLEVSNTCAKTQTQSFFLAKTQRGMY